MEYGLIGKTLKHSFSKTIHESIEDYLYELKEISEDHLDSFMRHKEFKAINVTIPYKEKVIPYLDEIDDSVKNIGACNVITNTNGKLKGYNTDFLGIMKMLSYFDISLKDKVIAILGTGGTSKTMAYVARRLGAKKIIPVSRKTKPGMIDYAGLKEISDEIEVIANTTPVGMYPDNFSCLIDVADFPHLSAVIDVVYNPIKTKLIVDAIQQGLKVAYGLYMLVAQAFYGIELFKNKKINEDEITKTYLKILKEKQNIVLIGMPGCGKSTIGKILSQELNKEFIDSDEEIIKMIDSDIASFIKNNGEEKFREVESKAIADLSIRQNKIIATGGGAVLKKANMDCLKQNGIIVFIDRDLNDLEISDSRPLSSNRTDLKKRYEERIHLYQKYADIIIKNDKDLSKVIKGVIEKL